MTTTLLPLLLSLSLAPVPDVRPTRLEAARELRESLGAADRLAEARLATLQRAARAAATRLGGSTQAARLERLTRDARWRELADPAQAAAWLHDELLTTVADLEFEPLIEAPLPVGFPSPTPAGEVELKRLPLYRLARAESRGAGGGFWTLFRHIQSHDIPMTAPVEMTYDGELRESTMAFLYQAPDVGSAGSDGAVEVLDVEPALVASIGCRGRTTRAAVAAAAETLSAWVAARPELTVDGPLRVMGYNSPMTPAARSFFEVQLPVREEP